MYVSVIAYDNLCEFYYYNSIRNFIIVVFYSIVQLSVTHDAVCGVSSLDDIYIWSLYTAKLIWSLIHPSEDWPKVRLVTSHRQTNNILLLLGNKLLLLSDLMTTY